MQDEILDAIKRVLKSGKFILNREGKALEMEFARWCGVDYGVGVASGTDALYIALRALNIGPGDEVITVSHTCGATICAIRMTGATPVFIDIDKKSMLMNPDLIEGAITKKTQAILPVHLYGTMCDMERINNIANDKHLYIVEDCAQSVGAGKLYGDIGCYSFYPTKNLGGIGDGGCAITNNSILADKMRALREYGYSKKFVSDFLGINSRLDEIQAAVLRVKLKYLPNESARRVDLAHIYYNRLTNTSLTMPKSDSVFHQFVVRGKQRDRLVKEFKFQIHYPVPCHLQPAYKNGSVLPVTEKVCNEILSLPMRISVNEAKELCNKMEKFL